MAVEGNLVYFDKVQALVGSLFEWMVPDIFPYSSTNGIYLAIKKLELGWEWFECQGSLQKEG